MGKINYGKVVLGGVLGGVVYDAISFVIHQQLLMKAFQSMVDAGLCQAPTPEKMPIMLAVGVWIGIVLAWFYAAVRPRFGGSAKTALRVGFAGWLLAVVPMTIMNMVWMKFPHEVCMTTMAGELVQYMAATLVAGWVYTE